MSSTRTLVDTSSSVGGKRVQSALGRRYLLPLTTGATKWVELALSNNEYCLACYENEEDAQHKFLPKLNGAHLVNNTTEKGPCLFLICTNGEFEFQADTKELFNAWLDIFLGCGVQMLTFDQLYRLKDFLGEGSFAKVYIGHHMFTGEEVCVKAVDKRKVKDSNVYTEIEMLRKVFHPYIIRLFAAYEKEATICLVLEYLKGGELFDWLSENGPYSESTAKQALRRVLHGLHCMHQKGVVHRDLKTENLILEQKGNPVSLKIIDFGLASTLGSSTMRMRCGSPGYVAPEILEDRPYGVKVDVFSVGVILFTLLAGYPPFRGSNVKEILRKNIQCRVTFNHARWGPVSQLAMDLVLWMTSRDPDRRCTASQALTHPWFEKIPSPLPNADVSLTRMTAAGSSARRGAPVRTHASGLSAGSASPSQSPKLSNLSPASSAATTAVALSSGSRHTTMASDSTCASPAESLNARLNVGKESVSSPLHEKFSVISPISVKVNAHVNSPPLASQRVPSPLSNSSDAGAQSVTSKISTASSRPDPSNEGPFQCFTNTTINSPIKLPSASPCPPSPTYSQRSSLTTGDASASSSNRPTFSPFSQSFRDRNGETYAVQSSTGSSRGQNEGSECPDSEVLSPSAAGADVFQRTRRRAKTVSNKKETSQLVQSHALAPKHVTATAKANVAAATDSSPANATRKTQAAGEQLKSATSESKDFSLRSRKHSESKESGSSVSPTPASLKKLGVVPSVEACRDALGLLKQQSVCSSAASVPLVKLGSLPDFIDRYMGLNESYEELMISNGMIGIEGKRLKDLHEHSSTQNTEFFEKHAEELTLSMPYLPSAEHLTSLAGGGRFAWRNGEGQNTSGKEDRMLVTSRYFRACRYAPTRSRMSFCSLSSRQSSRNRGVSFFLRPTLPSCETPGSPLSNEQFEPTCRRDSRVSGKCVRFARTPTDEALMSTSPKSRSERRRVQSLPGDSESVKTAANMAALVYKGESDTEDAKISSAAAAVIDENPADCIATAEALKAGSGTRSLCGSGTRSLCASGTRSSVAGSGTRSTCGSNTSEKLRSSASTSATTPKSTFRSAKSSESSNLQTASSNRMKKPLNAIQSIRNGVKASMSKKPDEPNEAATSAPPEQQSSHCSNTFQLSTFFRKATVGVVRGRRNSLKSETEHSEPSEKSQKLERGESSATRATWKVHRPKRVVVHGSSISKV